MLQMLRGIGGEFEINRVVGAIGALAYVLTTAGLTVFEVVARHRAFDVQTFATAWALGFAATMTAIAGAVAIKDRNVAKAKVDDPSIPNAPGAQL